MADIDHKWLELYARKGRAFEAYELIFTEESRGEEMYFILSGEVEIIKTYDAQSLLKGSGVRLEAFTDSLNVLKAGDFFGEMALLTDAPRMATARARTRVEAVVLSRFDLENMMMASPRLGLQMMKSMAERIRAMAETPPLAAVFPRLREALQLLDSPPD